MRYVIVSVVKGEAGNFNNNLRKEVFEKFHAKSSKLPAHFTIKAPFECENTDYMDNIIENFCKKHKKALYNTYLRLTSSALEQETPFCTADVIKSITVFQ